MDLKMFSISKTKTKSDRPPLEANQIGLSDPTGKGKITVEEAILKRRSTRSYNKGEIKENDLSRLLWAANGVTDFEQGLRAVPSAGALYPLEIYVAVAEVEGLNTGLYKYNPANHSLTPIMQEDVRNNLFYVCVMQKCIRQASALIIFCADFSRTSARYGRRSAQYVYMEVGHASQNVYLQAEALGLGTVAVGAFEDAEVRRILNLPDNEDPVYIMPIGNKK